VLLRILIVILALGGAVDSGLALRIHFQDPATAPPCAVSANFDCGSVNHSRYSTFLPGPSALDDAPQKGGIHIPVAAIGIVGYLAIAGLALANRLWLVLQATEIGFFFACFLTYLEAFVMEKWCIYCLWSQGLITAILALTVVALVMQHRAKKRVARFAERGVLVS
jgi:vitamin-K-epoxide reductase (warfarin-sensitive)